MTRKTPILILMAFAAVAALGPTFASAKPPAAEFWGLQTAGMLSNPANAPEETTAMKELGIHEVRMEIPWAIVQKNDGTCGGGPKSGVGGPESGIDWTPLDNRIKKAAEDGITILANLGARRFSSPTCGGYQTPGQEYNEWYKPGGFVTQVVQRYGVGGEFWSAGHPGAGLSAHAIKVWEVANEENYNIFAPAGGPNAKQYAKYLIDTSGAIKAVVPGATVLLGGLAQAWEGAIPPKTFLEEMLAGNPGIYTTAQLNAAFDGVSYHPYSLTNHHGYSAPGGQIGEFQYGEHAGEVLKYVEEMRTFLNGHGNGSKTLWLTEVGWPAKEYFGETTQTQADDLYETLHLLDLKAEANKIQYVGWYLFQDRECGASGCGWDDLAGLRELNKTKRYSWCAYSHLTGSFNCPYIPHGGFNTETTISEPTAQNGQPGSVSFHGTVNVKNIAGEPVTNLSMNINFYKENAEGKFPLQSTDHPVVTNGEYSEVNRPAGVGNWQVQAVFPAQGNFNRSESGTHSFSVKATSCATETFVTPSNPISSQPGFITINGHVNTVNPECGVVNGQYVNVNYYKENSHHEFPLQSTDHPVVYGGAYSEVNRPVGSGNWKVKTVFPAQSPYAESASGQPGFSIGANGWHIDNLGGTFTADPDISSQGPGRLDVFGRGAENGLWIDSYPSGSGWGGWVSMGGVLAGGPGAVSWSSGRIDVVETEPNQTVEHWYWTGGGWAVDNLGGTLTSDPDISSWGPNRLDVFARGVEGGLWHKWWGGSGWSAWEAMGGSLAGGPSAVSWGPGRIDVVARMTDNTIGHWYWAGAGWVYDNLGGTLTSDPSISSQGSGKLDVFARGTDNGLWHRWFTNSFGWSNWEPMGGYITSGPGSVSWGAGRVDVVARGANNSLEHWYFQE